MNDTVTIVDPAAEDSAVAENLARRLDTLSGAHVGVIDNSKHMAAELLAEVEALLQQRYGVKKVTRYRKANPSIPTPPDVLASLAANCDAVVHGVAD
jgi:hypothetical protein